MRGRTLLVAVAMLATAPADSSGTAETGPSGRIAYAPRVYPKDQRIGDNWEIYTVDAAGGRSLNLTRHPCSEHSPAWAHDGYRIAFVCTTVSWSCSATGTDVEPSYGSGNWAIQPGRPTIGSLRLRAIGGSALSMQTGPACGD